MNPKRKRKDGPSRRRLLLERLEDRRLLSIMQSFELDPLHQAEGLKPEYAPVGWLGGLNEDGTVHRGASGVLIANSAGSVEWVLTAAHLIDYNLNQPGFVQMEFGLGPNFFTDPGETRMVDAYYIHPEYSAAAGWGGSPDLALVHLAEPIVDVDPAVFYAGTLASGDPVSMAGYGAPGTNETGQLDFDGVKRGGTNIVEGFGGDGNPSYLRYSPYYVFSDFTHPFLDPTPLELLGSSGDSGSGLFVADNGQTYLAGINVFASGAFEPGLMYGCSGGAVVVSEFRDWIDETINPAAALNVTVASAATQAPLTKTEPVHFTATFSEPVTDFDGSDVAASGAPGTLTAIVSPIGADGMTYNIAVSGMTGSGVVAVSVPADAAHNAGGNGNSASTALDTGVIFDVTAPGLSVGDVLTNDLTPLLGGIATDANGIACVSVTLGSQTFPGVLNSVNGTWSAKVPSPVLDGTHTVTVTTTDLAGNIATDTATVVIDTAITAPADIGLTAVSAHGTTDLVVSYQIAGCPIVPFEFGFYRSTDAAFGIGDALIGRAVIDSVADMLPGTHTMTFAIGSGAGEVALPGAGAAEVDGDYFVLAVADHANAVDESGAAGGETNNTAVLTGVYHAANGPVMVHATAVRDVVKVLPQTERPGVQVDVNGVIYEYATDGVTGVRIRGHNGSDEFQLRVDSGFGGVGTLAFRFDGGTGTNTAKVWGSASASVKDVAELYATKAVLRGPGYSLSLAGMRGTTVDGRGGPDEAYIYDSSLNDTFTAYPSYVTLSNSLYTNRAESFRNVFAYAQNAGMDTANLHGIDGTRDYLRASATYAILADAETGRGTTYFIRANWFEYVHAHGRATNGRPSSVDRDQAMLYAAATADVFEAEVAAALATYRYTGASTINAHTFRVVKAYGNAADTANLFGPGTYNATPNPVMFTSDYTVWANGFASPNWYPSGRPSAPSSPTAPAVDEALATVFDENEAGVLPRKKPPVGAAVDEALSLILPEDLDTPFGWSGRES